RSSRRARIVHSRPGRTAVLAPASGRAEQDGDAPARQPWKAKPGRGNRKGFAAMPDIPKTRNSQGHSRSTPKSWRDAIPIHPAAELFPLMSCDELRALGEDIKVNGLTSPIAVTMASQTDKASVQLVDGRNRLDAMELVGIKFRLKWHKQPGIWCLL